MAENFQNRIMISLDKSTEYLRINKALKSPLGLAHELIRNLFNKSFDNIKNELDSIKKFVAGIDRAEELGSGYKIAKFYPYLFSFHQFFHSSYRARQGKTLE